MPDRDDLIDTLLFPWCWFLSILPCWIRGRRVMFWMGTGRPQCYHCGRFLDA